MERFIGKELPTALIPLSMAWAYITDKYNKIIHEI
jgi:hypothetical protein